MYRVFVHRESRSHRFAIFRNRRDYDGGPEAAEPGLYLENLAFTVVSLEMLSGKMRRSRQAFSSNFTYGYLMLLNKIIYSIYYENYRSIF